MKYVSVKTVIYYTNYYLILGRGDDEILVKLVSNILHNLLLDLRRGDDEIRVRLVSYILPKLLLNPG